MLALSSSSVVTAVHVAICRVAVVVTVAWPSVSSSLRHGDMPAIVVTTWAIVAFTVVIAIILAFSGVPQRLFRREFQGGVALGALRSGNGRRSARFSMAKTFSGEGRFNHTIRRPGYGNNQLPPHCNAMVPWALLVTGVDVV